MGSPLAPLLANWFMTSKKKSLTVNSEQKPIFTRVDDIFVLMKNVKDKHLL